MDRPPEFLILKEKVALCTDFTPQERDTILDALNLGEYSGKHEYPNGARPGSTPWATVAWAILDQLKPDALLKRDRFLLGGMIAGVVYEAYQLGREGKKYRPGILR